MNELVMPELGFRFQNFVDSTLRFLASDICSEVDPSFAVVTVKAPGDCPTFGPEQGRTSFLPELRQGLLLFFPFSSCNVGDPVPCADGESRVVDEGDERDDDDFVMGDVDCVGFLVALKEGRFVVNAAMHAGGACPGPAPSVDICDCGPFDEAMGNYLKTFL